MAHEVRLSSAAMRDLSRIPSRYVDAVLTFVYGALADNPRRVGKALGRDLEGLHSARRGSYRIVYEILDSRVLVHRVDHRAQVYRPR